MAKRIGALKAGDEVRLRFHGSKRFGNDPYELDLVFLRRGGRGEDELVVFFDPDAAGSEIEAYRHNGHWAYGSGGEKLTVVS